MRGLLLAVYRRRGLTRGLKIASYAAVILTLPVFALLVWRAFTVSMTDGAILLFISGIPFVLVTLLRRILSLPRPYEIYDFYDTPPKEKRGQSFPSRHVFSITLIGTLCLFAYPVLGGILLAAGLVMAVSRVLLGVHFIRDVVAGALIGVISALIGVLISNPFV